MKRNRSLLVALLLLVAITSYFILSTRDSTVRPELRDFAVKDTAAITKIFLADRNGHEVKFERKPKERWVLNEKFEPKPDLLKFLLDGIYKIKIRSQVANAAYNNVIKSLASSAIKCEIYLNGEEKPFKTYYVGGQTEDALGTFMMIENSAAPFVTHVPGFNGYLTPRYSPILDVWKQTTLFRYPLAEIRSVSVSYLNFPENSFTIQNEAGKYVVTTAPEKVLSIVDSVAVENYLSLYSNVYFEAWAKDVASSTRDSMLLSPPSVSVSVTDTKNKSRRIDIYPKPISSSSLTLNDSLGRPLKYDLDRMYGFIKPGDELIIVQHYTFDKLLRRPVDFLKKKGK